MNHIGIQYWPMRLQPSDYCEITISCQVCWRMRRWHNGRTRRSPNPKSEIVLRDCSVNGEESAAHSILARSDPLQQRPYTFAQTNLWRLQISLAARRRTIHFRLSVNQALGRVPYSISASLCVLSWWGWRNNVSGRDAYESNCLEYLQGQFLLRGCEVFAPKTEPIRATDIAEIYARDSMARCSWTRYFCWKPTD